MHDSTKSSANLLHGFDMKDVIAFHVYSDGPMSDPNNKTSANHSMSWAVTLVAGMYANDGGRRFALCGVMCDEPICVTHDFSYISNRQQFMEAITDEIRQIEFDEATSTGIEGVGCICAMLWSIANAPHIPTFLYIDNKAVVDLTSKQAFWSKNPRLFTIIRAVYNIFEEKGSVVKHVKAHSNQPWNESSDSIAKAMQKISASRLSFPFRCFFRTSCLDRTSSGSG